MSALLLHVQRQAVFMERIIDVSQYIYMEYKSRSGEAIDEMELHKLLYFA